MNMMNDVLADYLDDFVLVFLDDILVYSRTVEIHAEHLGKVLEALRRHCLYVKVSKCSILEEEVEFLGQWITPQGAAPLKQKMRAIVEWEAPQDLKGVRSLLGFANYYLWKRGWITFSLQLVTISVVASRVDSSTRVSWMLLQCAATTAPTGSDRGRGVEATRKPNKAFYKTPLQHTQRGG